MNPPALLKLLRARDAAMVDQGVALTAALGDPQLFDDLLEGVTYGCFSNLHRFRDPDARWIFKPNTLFVGNRSSQPWLDRAILGLIGQAPEGSKVASQLRAEATALWVGGLEQQDIPLDLSWFQQFGALKELQVHHHRPLKGLRYLKYLSKLEHLVLHACSLQDGFIGLDAPQLQELLVIGLNCERLEGLEGAPHLQVLRLHGSGNCRLQMIEQLHQLKELAISGFEIGSWPRFSVLSQLEELSIQSISSPLPPLTGMPALQALSLCDLPMEELPILDQLPTLNYLRIALAPDQNGLKEPCFHYPLPALKHLEIEADNLQQIMGLAYLPALEILELRSRSTLDLSSLQDSPLRRLTISASELKEIEVLPKGLEELSIHAPLLTQLKGLPSTLKRLFLPGCASLEHLDLQGITALEQLSLDGCLSLQYLKGTEHLYGLQTVDLRDTRSLREAPLLSNLPELRAIAIDGCAVTRPSFPQTVRQVLTADPRADLDALRLLPPPNRQRRVEDSGLQSFLKRLRIRDLGAIHAAIEDLQGVIEANPQRAVWFDRMLSGATVERRSSHFSGREADVLVPGPLLKGTRSEEPWREHVVRALVAAAPLESIEASRLRQEVDKLRVSGHVTLRRDPHTPVDMAPVAAFPQLNALTIECAQPLLHLEALQSLSLVTLDISGCSGISVLPPLPLRLRQLRVEAMVGLENLAGLESTAGLEELELSRLEIDNINGLSCLPRLRRLKLRHLPSVRSLQALTACTQLEDLEIISLPITDLTPLLRLPRLRRLSLEACANLFDLAPLAHTALTHLRLYQLYRLKDLRPLSRVSTLQAVYTDGCSGPVPPHVPLGLEGSDV